MSIRVSVVVTPIVAGVVSGATLDRSFRWFRELILVVPGKYPLLMQNAMPMKQVPTGVQHALMPRKHRESRMDSHQARVKRPEKVLRKPRCNAAESPKLEPRAVARISRKNTEIRNEELLNPSDYINVWRFTILHTPLLGWTTNIERKGSS